MNKQVYLFFFLVEKPGLIRQIYCGKQTFPTGDRGIELAHRTQNFSPGGGVGRSSPPPHPQITFKRSAYPEKQKGRKRNCWRKDIKANQLFIVYSLDKNGQDSSEIQYEYKRKE